VHELKKIQFVGKIVSGRGEGRKFLELMWVQRRVSEVLNSTPFPGTLNLRLDERSTKQRHMLNSDSAYGICTSNGYCTGLLFKATIRGIASGVVLPLVEGYPDDELEVVAEVNLRKTLGLRDCDSVEVNVFLQV
jgi:CTP-dependent riboflavin kinase